MIHVRRTSRPTAPTLDVALFNLAAAALHRPAAAFFYSRRLPLPRWAVRPVVALMIRRPLPKGGSACPDPKEH